MPFLICGYKGLKNYDPKEAAKLKSSLSAHRGSVAMKDRSRVELYCVGRRQAL
jgi:hypothetical protein